MLRPTTFKRTSALAVFAALIALTATAAPAGALTTTDSSSVKLPLGSKGEGLRVKGVKLTAVKPAKLAGATLKLPASDLTLPTVTDATVVLRGGLKLSRGGKSVSIKGLLLTVKGSKLTLTGKVGNDRISLATGSAVGTSIDTVASSAKLAGSKLTATKRAAGALNKALKVKSFKNARLGNLSGQAVVKRDAPIGPGGGDTPSSVFPSNEPPVLTRPSSATDVTTAGPLTWWPRESLIVYVREGLGTVGAEGSGTSAGTPISHTSEHACATSTGALPAGPYSFNLPFSHGWYDAASSSAALYYSGGVRFSYPSHGLNIFASDLEIEFNGANSRVIARVIDPDHPTGQRVVILTLPAAAPTASNTLTKYLTYITSEGNGALGGFYTPGSQWGCVEAAFAG